MAKTDDPRFYETRGSARPRNRLDRIWTNPWMTDVLMETMFRDISGPIWEPAAGRGDMSKVLALWPDLKTDDRYKVYSSDVDMSEFDTSIGPGHERSFLHEIEMPEVEGVAVKSIITNPPYSEPWRGIADDFIRHGLTFFQHRGRVHGHANALGIQECKNAERHIWGMRTLLGGVGVDDTTPMGLR